MDGILLLDLYPIIAHQAEQNTPKEVLEKRALKKIPTKNLVMKILEFVLNNVFEIKNKTSQQKLDKTIGTKYVPILAPVSSHLTE